MSRASLSAMLIGLSVVGSAMLNPAEAGQGAAAPRQAGAPVQFVAHDHGYTGPDRIPAGMTTVEIVNHGQDVHHAQIVKLAAEKTVEDFVSAMKADPVHWPGWVNFAGGPNGVMPGERASATMNLDAGHYMVLCIIPDRQGVPHVMLGMTKPFTVVPVRTVSTSEPIPDLIMTPRDFHFDLSKPITAGTQTIQVNNGGTQPHEVVVVKLEPGASVKDFIASFEPGASGPPPGRLAGGLVGLDRGRRAFFTATFEPGRYALMCFFPDQKTGQPHFAEGMISEFTVK
ncbi:hypothetical protein [Nitrospira moscoviensis]|uniref:Blue (type 1) copper domain-containing protein n=1 Tax=Nitrospira moscoviensis TaxID=42253 RepID=A0A0K2G7G3_NITMO|nr:hypothetical protein [Nitrospira moscoviensis]ALA56898.1 conserved exported protein of unknown function [Nitrospira moscoviensis]